MSLKKRNLADFGEDSDSDYGDSEQASILKRSKASTQSTNQTTINEQMEIDCIECMLHKIKCTDVIDVCFCVSNISEDIFHYFLRIIR